MNYGRRTKDRSIGENDTELKDLIDRSRGTLFG